MMINFCKLFFIFAKFMKALGLALTMYIVIFFFFFFNLLMVLIGIAIAMVAITILNILFHCELEDDS